MQKTFFNVSPEARSSVAASVAIAVAALQSAVHRSPPAGYGPANPDHIAYLYRSGFPEAILDDVNIFSASDGDGFTILIDSSVIEFVKTDEDTYACATSCGLLSFPMAASPHKDFGDTLFVTQNPLVAILGAYLGIPCVVVAEGTWMGPGVELPLSDDVIYRTQSARPNDRMVALATGRQVILDRSFGHSPQLGHSLQYHVDCHVQLWRGGSRAHLPPAVLAAGDRDTLSKTTEPLLRAVVSYAYDEFGGMPLRYHYPLCYRASDRFIPCVEKDVASLNLGKDGEEEWLTKRVKLKGVPNCRIRQTLIVTQPEGGIISLDRSAGAAQVIEVMEGVTATRREVTWHQQPTDYTTEAYIGRDFTKTLANELSEHRTFLAAQKGQLGHPIVFGTSAKGFFGLRFPDGQTNFPAGYIAEDRVLSLPGLPTIVPLGAKAGALSLKGTPEAWRKIMRVLLKNSSVAALMGFSASILIHPFVQGAEPGMIVLVGASGRGKTTAMRAVASMISEPSKPSKPGSYIMTFRTTENGLEGRLEAKNHCPSLIDEIGAASTGMNWSAAGYMIANGAGKLRMNADSSTRETKKWSTQTIASGEESFASKMNANGQADRGGIQFRVVDLHLEGIPFWEHLEAQVRDGSTGDYQPICNEYGPAAVTPTQVMDTVFAGLEQNHGHAWWQMVERMLDDDYRQKAADRLTAWWKIFTGKLDDRTEIIVHRRSVHLASAMAGLELILDTLGDELPAEERQPIIDGAAAWVETYLWRAGLPDGVVTEGAQLVERVLDRITLNPGRFFYSAGDERPSNFKQYWGVNFGSSGVTLFLAGLKDICKEMGEDYKRVRHALVDQVDEKKWTEVLARPASGAAPMRGLSSPATFHLLGYGDHS